jgi:periplasmic protein TonB
VTTEHIQPASDGSASAPLFSMFSRHGNERYLAHREAFVFSLLGQALIVGLLTYFTCCILDTPPEILRRLPKPLDLPLIFSSDSGGGGGNFDKLPASHGNLPRASLDEQIVPPNVRQPTAMPRLAVEETIVIAPDVKIPQGGQIGDPTSPLTQLSNGPGERSGIGHGCCGGVGDSVGPHAGSGPAGIYPAGKGGVTVPQVIYNPEPAFSEEARKAKQQGIVQLVLVVGKDGHTYDIHVSQSLGMGLDEEAIAAVRQWRFKPATLNGQPVATRVAVEVDFHLY